MSTPLPPRPENPRRVVDRMRRACELALSDLNAARQKLARTETAIAEGRAPATALKVTIALIRDLEIRLEAANRYRTAFERIYNDKTGFAAGFGAQDVVPFQLAWPMPRIYVPGIPNPHVPPSAAEKLAKPPGPVMDKPSQAPAKPRAKTTAHTTPADQALREPDTSKPIEVPVACLDPATTPEPNAPDPAANLVVDVKAADALPAISTGVEDAVGGEPAGTPKEASPVGYKCPPESGKFRENEGRPRPGRPKGAKGIKNIVIKSFGKKVVVTENGQRQSMSRLEALVETLIVAGLGRSPKDRATAIALAQKYITEEEPQTAAPLSEEHKEILKSQIALLRMLDDEDDEEGES